MKISLFCQNQITPLLVEGSAERGIGRIAEVVAQDICLVTGQKPAVKNEEEPVDCEQVILCATVGKSALLDAMEKEGKIDLSEVRGKWEVYKTAIVENPFRGVSHAIVIAGSDKRGTIYGMFSLSEYLGVSPYVFFGDVLPEHQDNPIIEEDFCKTSREPSVKYRGFFINDEWPCYGTWVTKHYGGSNAESYEQIFLFLLRMKGNYMWPAMWSASFPLDGPGSANEELADLLGVVMGYSHHEPCLRASEEWDKVRGEGTRYGNAWNYVTNEQGLLNYWEDALIRSGRYDNMITIGMRGERDTSMLGEQSSVQENVELLKKIILAQKELIHRHVHPYRPDAPMLLALYKEVEQYYYGNEEIDGLYHWEGLDDVICMLCEDNHGHMRTLPTKEMREKKQKFGMYYHLDYHGGPVSYEWVDSTPFSKVWEQMCAAYDFGIRDAWIVNVGDLKFHEVVLGYFMNLAYDYETWGSSNHQSPSEYIDFWCRQNFPSAGRLTQHKIGQVLDEYISINHLRRPESLHAGIYHPCYFDETDRLLKRIEMVEKKAEEVTTMLGEKAQDAFYSCVHYPLMASMNNIKLHLYAGKNRHYASQGRQAANGYKRLAEACMKRDAELIREFSGFLDGKWDGMQLAAHIGFTKWNEDGCRMPVLAEVYPVNRKRMNVSRKDSERIYDKVYGAPMVLEISDFMYEGADRAVIEIANDGPDSIHYEISGVDGEIPAWVKINYPSGDVAALAEVTISVDKTRLAAEETAVAMLRVSDGDTVVHIRVYARGHYAKKEKCGTTFYEKNGAVIMRADHFAKNEPADGSYQVLDGYGKYGAGVKVFPLTNTYSAKDEAPAVTYRFRLEKAGKYKVTLFTTPSNPYMKGQSVNVGYRIGENGTKEVLNLIPSDFRAGENSEWRWGQVVLEQIRKTSFEAEFVQGVNTLTIYAMEPGVVLQQIGIYDSEVRMPEAYLGQEESFFEE